MAYVKKTSKMVGRDGKPYKFTGKYGSGLVAFTKFPDYDIRTGEQLIALSDEVEIEGVKVIKTSMGYLPSSIFHEK